MTLTPRRIRMILTPSSLLLMSVLATMAVFTIMAGPLHISGVHSAFAQGNNVTTSGNQTGGNATATGNQTSSSGGGDMDQGDPDGDGI